MKAWTKRLLISASAVAALVCGPASGGRAIPPDASNPLEPQGLVAAPATRPSPQPDTATLYARGVTRQGRVVVVSKELAEAAKKDPVIVFTTVAIKARVDRNGLLRAYEIVQADRGGIPHRLGFRAKDLITRVNGIPAASILARQPALMDASRFEVRIIRKGKARKIVVEIR